MLKYFPYHKIFISTFNFKLFVTILHNKKILFIVKIFIIFLFIVSKISRVDTQNLFFT